MAPMTGCDPSEVRPQSLGLLEGDSLLNAAPAKTCDLHVTYGVPWGVWGTCRRAQDHAGSVIRARGDVVDIVHYDFQYIIDHTS